MKDGSFSQLLTGRLNFYLGNLRLICALTVANIHQEMQADAKENG